MTLKQLMLIFILFPVNFVCHAQTGGKQKITGNIKTGGGSRVENISVFLKNTRYGSLTDSKGGFSFEAPAGEYTLIVQSIFILKKELSVTIENSPKHLGDIEITENKQTLDEVVITGQFSPQSLKESVYKVRVIGSEQIGGKAATSVQSLLNTEIGLRLSNDMLLGETDFELMGMGGNNIKVLVDGVPMADRGSNRQSLSQIDINTIERVEIIEGPMSVVYGTDALAGVINIITKKTSSSAGKNTFNLSARIQEESSGREYSPFAGKGIHQEGVYASWANKNGFYINGGLSRNSSGGWQGEKTGREKQWQPKEQYLAGATAGYKKEGLSVWYSLDYLNEKINTPANGTSLTPDMVSDTGFLSDRFTGRLQADWYINSRISLNLASSFQNYRRLTRTVISDLSDGSKWLSDEETAQDTTSIQTVFARLTALWEPHSKIKLQSGLEFQWDKISGGRTAGTYGMTDCSIFLSAEWKPLKWLNVRPGLRAMLNSDYDAPPVIPSLLAKVSISENMDLRLSYARGFRAPTLSELYFSFHNANHNIDGNPDLKAEFSNNFTASFTYAVIHGENVNLTSTVTGFYNDFRNRIAIAQDINDFSHNIYQNIGHYKTVGGTLENVFIWKNFQADVAYSHIGRYNRYNENDPELPEFRFSDEVSASLGCHIPNWGTKLRLFYKFTGARMEHFIDPNDNNSIRLMGMDGFHWADFTVNQEVAKNLSASAGIKNLFGVTMVNNTSMDGHGSISSGSIVGYGRSYFIGLSYRFDT